MMWKICWVAAISHRQNIVLARRHPDPIAAQHRERARCASGWRAA
jgi:hypothetical protein